jgi:hypothetical protein
MNERELAQVLAALREDLRRVESKMDKVLSLVDMIPNPIIRKLVKNKIAS